MNTFRNYYLLNEDKRASGFFTGSKSISDAVENLTSANSLARAEEVKKYLSGDNPFFIGNELRYIYLEPDSTKSSGGRYSITILQDKEERLLIRDFFKESDLGFISIIFGILVFIRNFRRIADEEVRNTVYRYLPDSFFTKRNVTKEEKPEEPEKEEEESPEEEIEESTKTTSGTRDISTILNLRRDIDVGFATDIEKTDINNKIPAVVYVMTKYFRNNQKGDKIASYKENILGSPKEKIGILLPFFIETAPNSDRIKNFKTVYSDQAKKEEMERIEKEEKEKREKPEDAQLDKEEQPSDDDSQTADGKGDYQRPKSTQPTYSKPKEEQPEDKQAEKLDRMPKSKIKMSDNAKKFLSMSTYHKKSIDDAMNEFTALDSLMDKAQNGSILASFKNGSSIDVNVEGIEGGPLSLFNYSIKQANKDFSKVFTGFTEKKYKEKQKEIRAVKRAGSKLAGKITTSMKGEKGLDELGRAVGAEDLEESTKLRNIKKLGSGKFRAIDSEMIKIKKQVREIKESGGRDILRADLKKLANETRDKIVDSAENIIFYYYHANMKHRKSLAKKVQNIKNRYTRIKKYDEVSAVADLGYDLNRMKGNFSSMVSRLNKLLESYREILGIASYKVSAIERNQQEYMDNKKDYQVLKTRARDRYFDEKEKREESRYDKEEKDKLKKETKNTKTILAEIDNYINKTESENKDLSKSEDFKMLKLLRKKYEASSNTKNINELVKKYDKVRFGGKGSEEFKKAGKSEREILKAVRAIYGQEKTEDAMIASIMLAKKDYSEEDANNLFGFISENKGLYGAFAFAINELKKSYKEFEEFPSAGKSFKQVAIKMNGVNRAVSLAINRKDREESSEGASEGEEKPQGSKEEKFSKRTSGGEEKDKVSTKKEYEKKVREASQQARGIRKIINRIYENMKKRASETGKYMHDLMRNKSSKVEPDEEKMASLYFKEDSVPQQGNEATRLIAELFKPHKAYNDRIIVNINRASSSSTLSDIYENLKKVEDIINSKDRPEVIVFSYVEKIFNNVDLIFGKLDEILLKDSENENLILNITNIIKQINTWMRIASINLSNRFEEGLKRMSSGAVTPNIKMEKPEEEIPKDAKPAITTKKINDEDEKPEEEEPENEETGDEPKNLLDLVRRKIKAGK